MNREIKKSFISTIRGVLEENPFGIKKQPPPAEDATDELVKRYRDATPGEPGEPTDTAEEFLQDFEKLDEASRKRVVNKLLNQKLKDLGWHYRDKDGNEKRKPKKEEVEEAVKLSNSSAGFSKTIKNKSDLQKAVNILKKAGLKDDTTIGHFLDSTRGRHLADMMNSKSIEDSDIAKVMSKEVKDFMKRYNPKNFQEEAETLDELRKSTYVSYLSKAGKSLRAKTSLSKDFEDDKYQHLKKVLKHSPNVMDTPAHEKDPEKLKKARKNMDTADKISKDFKRGADNRIKGIARAGRRLAKEENLDEISGATLGSYIVKSKADDKKRAEVQKKIQDQVRRDTGMKNLFMIDKKKGKRLSGRGLALKKLSGRAKVNASEETENLDEISKDVLRKYVSRASQDAIDRSDKKKFSKNLATAYRDYAKRYGKSEKSQEAKARAKKEDDYAKKQGQKEIKRYKGIGKASSRLAKEEHLDEGGTAVMGGSYASRFDTPDGKSKTKFKYKRNDPNRPRVNMKGEVINPKEKKYPPGLMGAGRRAAEKAKAGAYKNWSAKKEETENLDEISKDKLAHYVTAAVPDAQSRRGMKKAADRMSKDNLSKARPNDAEILRKRAEYEKGKEMKRWKGIAKAANRLSKEDYEELDKVALSVLEKNEPIFEAMPGLKKFGPTGRHEAQLAAKKKGQHSFEWNGRWYDTLTGAVTRGGYGRAGKKQGQFKNEPD